MRIRCLAALASGLLSLGSAARADTVYLANGRTFENVIAETTETEVKIRMPGGSGLELLEKVKRGHPSLPVIIMTAFSDLESAVSAFQGGAFEYLPKPFDLPKAVELIRRAMQESQREQVSEQRMAALKKAMQSGDVGQCTL